ncbi:MAG: hypothetical protein GC136_04780 [Alphaproteobacteria bacterium]|nr:hypothetical protein [Alphaproteobacteria bacterium]
MSLITQQVEQFLSGFGEGADRFMAEIMGMIGVDISAGGDFSLASMQRIAGTLLERLRIDAGDNSPFSLGRAVREEARRRGEGDLADNAQEAFQDIIQKNVSDISAATQLSININRDDPYEAARWYGVADDLRDDNFERRFADEAAHARHIEARHDYADLFTQFLRGEIDQGQLNEGAREINSRGPEGEAATQDVRALATRHGIDIETAFTEVPLVADEEPPRTLTAENGVAAPPVVGTGNYDMASLG